MSIFATLGEIELEVTLWPEAMEARYQAAYATQDLIGRKGLLQHTGFAPDEVDLTATLHANWCNPAAELARLKTAMDDRLDMALVLGNGDYKGVFVVTSLDVTTRQTDGTGTVLALELAVKLKEFIGDPGAPYLPGVVGAGVRLPLGTQGAQSSAGVDLADAAGPVAQVASAASSALAAAAQVATVAAEVASFASLASAAPGSALLALPGVLGRVGAAAGGLPVAALQGLQQVAGVAAQAGEVAQAFGQAQSLLQGAHQALGAGLGGASAAAWNTVQALRTLDGVRAPLAGLAQAAVLRGAELWA